MLTAAERPVIIAGNGVRISQAYDELASVASNLGIAVSTTAGGKGTFPETHELALGVCGAAGRFEFAYVAAVCARRTLKDEG